MPLTKQDFLWLFKRSRPLNLLIAASAYSLSSWFAAEKTFYFLKNPLWWWELILIGLIMIGGYWINDVYDAKTDALNPHKKNPIPIAISAKKIFTAYWVNLIVSLGLTLLFAPTFLLWNIAAMLLLFFYSCCLKQWLIVGNVVIALLTTWIILLPPWWMQWSIHHVWLAFFAFFITLLREIAKDAEDLPGDLATLHYTLPIAVGLHYTRRILQGGYLFLLFMGILPAVFQWYQYHSLPWLYLLIFYFGVGVPLIYLIRHLNTTELSHKVFCLHSRMLKAIIPVGMLSIILL